MAKHNVYSQHFLPCVYEKFSKPKGTKKKEPVLTKNFLQPSTTATMLVVLNIHTELLCAIIIEPEVNI